MRWCVFLALSTPTLIATAQEAPATEAAPATAAAPAADATPATPPTTTGTEPEAKPQAQPAAEPIPEPAPLPVPVAPPPEPTPVAPAPAEATPVEAPVAEPRYGAPPRPERHGRRVAVPGGLYIRLGAGLGFPFGPEISDDYEELAGDDLRFSGQALALEVLAGGAALPWLVVGAGFVQDVIVGGTVRNADDDEREIARGLYYAIIGPFIDVYTSPPGGFHMQALIGFAHMSPSYDLSQAATGIGTVLGLGYELRASKRWNVGVLGRLAVSSLDRGDVAGEERTPTVYEPALLITATFFPEAD